MAPKVVLITGCSTGIGLDTAVLLASDKEQRFKVFATMRNLAKKEQLEKAAGAALDKTLFIRELDVTKEDTIVNFTDKLTREDGGVDILSESFGHHYYSYLTLLNHVNLVLNKLNKIYDAHSEYVKIIIQFSTGEFLFKATVSFR